MRNFKPEETPRAIRSATLSKQICLLLDLESASAFYLVDNKNSTVKDSVGTSFSVAALRNGLQQVDLDRFTRFNSRSGFYSHRFLCHFCFRN